MFYSAKEGGFFLTKETQDAVEISTEEHAKLLAGQCEGKEIVSDNKGYPILKEPNSPRFETVKSNLKTVIDNAAETERLKYITNGVGQSMTYQEKVNQATNYSGLYTAHLADPDNNPKPNDDEYLLLKAKALALMATRCWKSLKP